MNINRIAGLTDKELYKLCRECGANIRTFNKEFAGYLPEVEKRKLYKKYRCHTLYEFAAKHAGMSGDTVDDIMNVHKKLEDKPILQRLIGKQGWSKVKVVATIARPETEKFWAEKVQAMAKGTLKTFVKELRKETNEVMASGQTGLFANTTPTSLVGRQGLSGWRFPGTSFGPGQVHRWRQAKKRLSLSNWTLIPNQNSEFSNSGWRRKQGNLRTGIRQSKNY